MHCFYLTAQNVSEFNMHYLMPCRGNISQAASTAPFVSDCLMSCYSDYYSQSALFRFKDYMLAIYLLSFSLNLTTILSLIIHHLMQVLISNALGKSTNEVIIIRLSCTIITEKLLNKGKKCRVVGFDGRES